MDDFASSQGWVEVGLVTDIPRLGSRVVASPRGAIAVFRTAADEIFALEDRCPHRGGPLSQGIVHGRAVTCPLHAWAIDLSSGEAAAPDRGCTPKIPAKVEGGRIFLAIGPLADTPTTCPYCGVGCGVLAHKDGTIKGDPAHPANAGRLCSKGTALAETLIDKDRLLEPAIDRQAASWDQALDVIAETFKATIAEHGPDSVAFYVSGQLLTEDYYVANKLMKGFIGSANIDTNSRLCMASAVAGHKRAFGGDVVPGQYEDWELADLVVLVGSNTAWCHPVLYQRLVAAKAARGTRIVTIDPRRTATAESADLHLSLAAGTDVALWTGLLVHLARAGKADPAWVGAHTEGVEAALGAAGASAGTIASVARITGLAKADIRTFYDWFAATDRTVTVFSQGVNQSEQGTDKVNAILNCHLLTGRIGRAGTGPFSVTGQPNAMGGREVGGLANQLAAHMGFDDPADIDRVRRFWNAPNMATRPGLKAVDLFEAVRRGEVRALWIMATNPAASMPDADRVREALRRCPFVVASDCWATDTTRLARVVLPAAGWAEKDGTVTNSERRISRQRGFRALPGAVRPDWWAVARVGRRMGWAEAFDYPGPAAIFREHARLSGFENDGGRAFDIGAMAEVTDAEYQAMRPFLWPASKRGDAGPRLFAEGGFTTPSGRARFVPVRWRPAQEPEARFPFILNTGRIRDQWHTMTRTGLVPRLMSHIDRQRIAVSPRDAARHGIADGTLVRLTSPQGTVVLPAQVRVEQRSGELFVSMHWTDDFNASGPIDRLVSPLADPVFGQPALKGTRVALEVLATEWHGILVRCAARHLAGEHYWTRIPLEGAQSYALAGWQRRDLGELAAGLLDDPIPLATGDVAAGLLYYATRAADGYLDAALVLAPACSALPDAAGLAALLGEAATGAAELARLIRRHVGSAGEGRVVCACFGVGERTIRDAMAAGGLTRPEQIGARLKAGTSCGSCLPELREMLRHAPAEA